MVRKAQKRARRMLAIADPDAISAIIDRRGDGGPPRVKLPIGKALTPAALVSALIDLHNYLNSRGPTTEWDEIRSWLFNYVDMYKSQLALEKAAPQLDFRVPLIKAGKPFTKNERSNVARALALKKGIALQVRGLKARRVWW